MFVNVVNITIPVSYDSILVRSLFFLKHKLRQFSAKAEKTMPKWPTLQLLLPKGAAVIQPLVA